MTQPPNVTPPPPAGSSGAPRRTRQVRWAFIVPVVLLLVVAIALVVISQALSDSGSPSVRGGGEELPAQPADYIEILDASTPVAVGNEIAEEAGLIWGPHFALRVAAAGATQYLHGYTTDLLGEGGEGFRAAPGHELVLASFALDPNLRPRWDDSHDVSAAVIVGDQRRELVGMPEGYDVLVVSAPEGEPVLLEITDTGVPQTFDLRSGERAEVNPLLYPLRDTMLPAPRIYQGNGFVSHRGARQGLTVDLVTPNARASLEPYVPSHGWAKPGRAWLLIGTVLPAVLEDAEFDDGVFPVAVELQAADTFVLRPAGGRPIRAEKQWIAASEIGSEFTVLFNVPASLRTADLVINPRGALATDVTSPTLQGMDAVTPHNCGTPADIVCVSWSDPPPTKTVSLALE